MSKSFNHHESVYSDTSAEQIIPLLVELFSPRNVIDVGCGIANFLKVFGNHDIVDVKGLDGDWVDLNKLGIPVEKFEKIDLERGFDEYVRNNPRKYDLLISLEVAEHLSPNAAENFVGNLCKLSNTIVFSAAIPFQGGQDHINEQWQTYWIKIFNKNGFVCDDTIRKRIWNNSQIHWWYRQNILHFTKTNDQAPVEWQQNKLSFPPDVVHPDHYKEKAMWINNLETGNITWGYAYFHIKNVLKNKIK